MWLKEIHILCYSILLFSIFNAFCLTAEEIRLWEPKGGGGGGRGRSLSLPYCQYSLGTYKPPLLVQRCNGTTAGLGHLEVVGMPIAHAQVPPQAVNL